MSDQLLLLDPHPPWRLDSSTRERGQRGVASARAVVQEARARARVAAEGDPGHGAETAEEPPEGDALPATTLARCAA